MYITKKKIVEMWNNYSKQINALDMTAIPIGNIKIGKVKLIFYYVISDKLSMLKLFAISFQVKH